MVSAPAPAGTPGQTPIKSPQQKKLKVYQVPETPEVAPEGRLDDLDSKTTMDWELSTPRDLSVEFENAKDAAPTPRVPTVEVTSPKRFCFFQDLSQFENYFKTCCKAMMICPRIRYLVGNPLSTWFHVSF